MMKKEPFDNKVSFRLPSTLIHDILVLENTDNLSVAIRSMLNKHVTLTKNRYAQFEAYLNGDN